VKADKLRQRVTDPKQRASLDRAIGGSDDKAAKAQNTGMGSGTKKVWAVPLDEYRAKSVMPYQGTGDGEVWRVQPAGAKLHGQKSQDSNGDEIRGVFVFDNLNELAAIDWDRMENVELVKIKVGENDTFTTRDVEGVGLKAGRGKIVARKQFTDTSEVRDWASSAQSRGWGKGIHRKAVENALKAGEDVPVNVLKDYPDLAASHVNHADTFSDALVAGSGKAHDTLENTVDRLTRKGASVLSRLSKAAVSRALKSGTVGRRKSLLDADELIELADMLASVLSTADLIGRARIRQSLAKRLGGGEKFADPPTPTPPPYTLPATIPLLPPEKALDYFSKLVPTLGVDPEVYGPLMKRRAFTLAVATDKVILENVQSIIRDSMANGNAEVIADVQEVLDKAGVSPKNPQYAELVVRTNTMDAYNQGHEEERMDPDVLEFFPVSRWDSIRDERTRESHAERSGKYYPGTVSFQEVRGNKPEDVINCRCVFTGIFRDEWERLKKAGAKLETSW